MLAMSTSPPSAGASSCTSAAIASSAATAAGAAPSCAPVATTSSTAAAAGSVLSLEQGAGAPTAPRAPRQWELDYDFRPAPPLCPIRLRRPPRRAPLAAPPAYKDNYSSASVLIRWVLDYSSQDILPLEAWSP
jgi:hypothetical protein